MKRVLAFVLCAFVLADPANACSTLTPEGQRRELARQEGWLQDESSYTVFGTWKLVSTKDTGDSSWPLSYGVVTSRTLFGKPRKINTVHTQAINCGFPRFPDDGEIGTFYMRRDSGADWLVQFRPGKQR